MLFLDHSQVQYCQVQDRDKIISGVIYNENLFIREKAFPKEEMEAAIKECREEYLDHIERSQIPTLLIKGKKSIGIWMQNNQHKANIISLENPSQVAGDRDLITKQKNNSNRINLKQLIEEMRSEKGVEIKTRRHKLKLFQYCFLGNEAVTWISNRTKLSREDAVKLGQKMLEKGFFFHVLDESQFKDEELFYRFKQDEGKNIWNSSL
jgi:hypothetical protein